MFIGPCIVIYFYSKANQLHQRFNFILFGVTLYMFRTVFPPIIRSSRLYIQQQACVKQILLSAWQQADSSICLRNLKRWCTYLVLLQKYTKINQSITKSKRLHPLTQVFTVPSLHNCSTHCNFEHPLVQSVARIYHVYKPNIVSHSIIQPLPFPPSCSCFHCCLILLTFLITFLIRPVHLVVLLHHSKIQLIIYTFVLPASIYKHPNLFPPTYTSTEYICKHHYVVSLYDHWRLNKVLSVSLF